jgi:CRP-like cAMP-binding protein
MVDDSPVDVIALELFMHELVGTAPTRRVASRLAARTRRARYGPGDTLHRAGERTGLIHLVTQGEIELSSPEAEPQRIGAPGTVGFSDFIQRRAHARTAVTVGDVRSLVLHGNDLLEVVEEDAEFAQTVVVQAAEQLLLLQMDLAPDGGFPSVVTEDAARGGRAHLTLADRILALRGAFSDAGIHTLATLAGTANEITLAPGQKLRSQGDPARSFFVVASGIIRAERVSPAVRARFGPGSIVGGIAAVGATEHAYTSVAESPAVLLRIHDDLLFDVMEDHGDLLRALFAELGAEREHLLARKAARIGARRASRDVSTPT